VTGAVIAEFVDEDGTSSDLKIWPKIKTTSPTISHPPNEDFFFFVDNSTLR
jgi:hypothetical protein